MKIWVDGQCFQTGSNVRGIGRYVADFLQALTTLDPGVRLIIGLNGSMKEEAIAARNYLEKAVPGCEISIWYGLTPDGEFVGGYREERMADESLMAAHINSVDPDIALSPSPFEGFGDRTSPFIKTRPVKALTACIFHDAIPHRYPDIYLKEENAYKLYYRRFQEIDNFDLVLCNSKFTEKEYRQIYQKENSVAIGAGLSNKFPKMVEAWEYDADSYAGRLGRYALYVGGMDWRKNVPFLVRAISRLGEAISDGFKLVLAGDHHEDLIKPLRDSWVARGLDADNLIMTGWVSDETLVDLYKNAAVTLQPSRMEGFGLGALEAMVCGSPFLSAFGGAVAEVVDNDEVLFDPDVPPSLADLLSRVLNEEDFRDQLVAHGYERVKAFTWEKSASIALEALRKALVDDGRTVQDSAEPSGPVDKGRWIIDVSSTAQSPVLSGIQRVMFNLSEAALDRNGIRGDVEAVLSYCRGTDGWYEVPRLRKEAVSLAPTNRMPFKENDRYLLLDSSWTFTEGQRVRLLDAMVMGQEVVHGVHDIGPLTMSAMTDEGMPPAFRRWFEFILAYSTGIVCVSRSVADEIYDLLCAIELPRPMKIGYFPLGADFADVPADIENLEFVKERPTFLMVGTIEPRKGHMVALRAFEKLWSEGVDVNLLLVGKAGWDVKLLVELLKRHPEREKRLFWRSGLSDGGLRAAYEVSDALVMTSYLEGFGLPVVEAGRFGCPVILSDIPVFREVGQGAPWAGYFERGNSNDLARVVQDFLNAGVSNSSEGFAGWPFWAESAEILENVIFGEKWYKHYEPQERMPNVRLSDIGKTTTTVPLMQEDSRRHSLRVIEGPFYSSAGNRLRIVVALRNDSDQIWSSTPQEGGVLGVNLSYHLYNSRGDCISYDNPRTSIPFVLVPGQELFMPVRIDAKWLAAGATRATLEVVQEGVTWFGDAVSVDLMSPHEQVLLQETDHVLPSEDLLGLQYLSGPFRDGNGPDDYYLLMLTNWTGQELAYQLKGHAPLLVCRPIYEGKAVQKGAWIVTHFDNLLPNGIGYVCVFVSREQNELPKALHVSCASLNLEWMLDLQTGEVSPVATLNTAQPEIAKAEQKTWDAFESHIPMGQAALQELSLRGFNEMEESHVWMAGPVGEVGFAGFNEADIHLHEVQLFCMAVSGGGAPLQLKLVYNGIETDAKPISSEHFMQYRFPLKGIDAPLVNSRESGHFKIISNLSLPEENGDRNLSVAIAAITLIGECQ